MIEIHESVRKSLDRIFAAEVPQMIEEQIRKTVAETIRDVLRPSAEFGKQLRDAVAAALALNGSLDLPSYNHTILAIVRRQVEAYTHNEIERQVAENLQTLLQPPPSEIKLSELVETYVEYLRDHAVAGCVCHGDQVAYVKFGRSSGDSSMFFNLDLSEEPPATHQRADVRIGLMQKKRADDKGPARCEVYHLAFPSGEVEKQMFAGPFHGFERMVFAMKAAKTEVVIDCEDPAREVDLNYGPAD